MVVATGGGRAPLHSPILGRRTVAQRQRSCKSVASSVPVVAIARARKPFGHKPSACAQEVQSSARALTHWDGMTTRPEPAASVSELPTAPPHVPTPLRDFLPFAAPLIGEEEIQEVVDTLRSSWITTGPKAKRFE